MCLIWCLIHSDFNLDSIGSVLKLVDSSSTRVCARSLAVAVNVVCSCCGSAGKVSLSERKGKTFNLPFLSDKLHYTLPISERRGKLPFLSDNLARSVHRGTGELVGLARVIIVCMEEILEFFDESAT